MNKPLADCLQVWGLEDGITIFTDGSLGLGLALRALDISCWSDQDIMSLDDGLKNFLNSLPAGVNFQFIQDITDGNMDVIDRFLAPANIEKNELAFNLAQQRAQKYRYLEEGRLLPRYKCYLFFRKKFEFGSMNKIGLFSKDKLFPEIIRKELNLELKKILSLKDDLIRSLTTLGIEATQLNEESTLDLLYKQWNPGRDIPFATYDPSDVRPFLLYSDCYPSEQGIVLGGVHHRLISLKILPGQSYSSMMNSLKELPFASRLFITIYSPDQIKEIEALQMQRRLAFSMVYGKQSGVSDLESEAKLADLEHLLAEMISSGEKIFHFALNVLLKSESVEELNDQVSQTILKIRELGGAESMQEGLAAFDIFKELALPNARAKERVNRIKTSNLSHFVPVYGPWQGHQDPKVLLRSRMGTLVGFDPFSPSLSNANQIVSGGSGSGKSFLTNLLLIQMLKNDPLIFLVDIGGSYKKMCENIDGQYISLGLNSGMAINPFDLGVNETTPSSDKLKFLLALVENMAKEDSEKSLRKLERSELEEAITECYKVNRNPQLSTLQSILLKHDNDELKRIGKILSSWTGDSAYGKFLDRPTQIELARPLICFDLKELEVYPDLQAICLLIITDLVNRSVQQDKTRMKFLVFDECWKLLKDDSATQFIESVFRTFRKYFASCIAIAQNIDDFAKSKIAEAIMPNTSIKWVLKQKGADKGRLKLVLDLNDREVDLISSLSQVRGHYSEAFLICEDQKSVVSVESSPLEYWIATTDPRDLSYIEELKRSDQNLTSFQIITKASIEYPNGISGGKL